MAVRVIAAELRGAEPLAAAARFHAEILPAIETALEAVPAAGVALIVRFDHAAEKPHRWRNEAIAALARKHAPRRVNAVAPARSAVDESAMAATIAFLAANEGITGQLLIVA